MFTDKSTFVARQMLLGLVPDPLRWSVGRTDADRGNGGFELAFCPFRQFTVATWLSASMSSAGIDRISGTCRHRGRPRLATGQISSTQISRTQTGYLEVTRDADSLG
jgi:hypothetical protein